MTTLALLCVLLTAFCMWSMTKNRALHRLLRDKEEQLRFTERLLNGEDEQ